MYGSVRQSWRELLLLIVATVAICRSASITDQQLQDVTWHKCNEDDPVPIKVELDCAGNTRNACLLRRGLNHTIHVQFTPETNSSYVLSSAAWRRWVEVPLMGQEEDACLNALACPLIAKQPTNFTYTLEVDEMWKRRRTPLIWRLLDEETKSPLLCFVVPIAIS